MTEEGLAFLGQLTADYEAGIITAQEKMAIQMYAIMSSPAARMLYEKWAIGPHKQ